MRELSDVVRFVSAQPPMLELLRAVASLSLPDGWIAAGFLRNAIWDELHGRDGSLQQLQDVDVIYFDPMGAEGVCEQATERRLHALHPTIPWSVKNQARMHLRNGDPPYRSCVHAMWHWPETATAIAARVTAGGAVEVVTAHGVQDLFSLIVRPTPHFQSKRDVYRARLAAKDWATRWPRLRFAE